MTSVDEVPAAYRGVWSRTCIRRRDGSEDRTTRVWWLQSAQLCFDLRIPAGQSRDGQTAFAGRTEVRGDRCEWHPEIAHPALSGDLDAGTMRFDSPDRVHETGIDGSYDEDWVRLAPGPVIGARLESIEGEIAYLLVSDAWAAWASQGDFSVARYGPGSWSVVASTAVYREGQPIFTNDVSVQAARSWAAGSSLSLGTLGTWRVMASAP